MHRLLTVVDDALDRASKLGFSPQEVFLTLYARTQALPNRAAAPPEGRTLFIECSQAESEAFGAEIRRALSVPVDPMLLSEFVETVRREPGFLEKYRLVITTFYHVHEVQALVAGTGIEVFALMVDHEPGNPDAPDRATGGDHRRGRVHRPDRGRKHEAFDPARPASNTCAWSPAAGTSALPSVVCFESAAVVVCSSLVETTVRDLAPRGKEIIVDHKTPGSGGN